MRRARGWHAVAARAELCPQTCVENGKWRLIYSEKYANPSRWSYLAGDRVLGGSGGLVDENDGDCLICESERALTHRFVSAAAQCSAEGELAGIVGSIRFERKSSDPSDRGDPTGVDFDGAECWFGDGWCNRS